MVLIEIIKLTLIAHRMSVARSERFIYFQNKANHYNKLRNIKSSIDHSSPRQRIPKPKVYRPLPPLQQHYIQVENEKLIDRLVHITKSPRRQVQVEGSYSRYHKVERPFRNHNPHKDETERSMTIDNSELKQRLNQAKAVVGTKDYWNKEYSKSICCRNNLSKYLEDHKSKAELHISTERFIPQHLRDYALGKNLDSSLSGKEATVSMEKLFVLPQIEKTSRVRLTFDELASKSKPEITF